MHSDSLYDIYYEYKSAKELWTVLEDEYGINDAGISVLNIGYRRYIGRQNYIPDTGYRVIYRVMVLNTGRQIKQHIR